MFPVHPTAIFCRAQHAPHLAMAECDGRAPGSARERFRNHHIDHLPVDEAAGLEDDLADQGRRDRRRIEVGSALEAMGASVCRPCRLLLRRTVPDRTTLLPPEYFLFRR